MDVIRLIRWAMVNSIKSNFWPEARRLELLFIEQTVCFAKFLPAKDLIQGWGRVHDRPGPMMTTVFFALDCLPCTLWWRQKRIDVNARCMGTL